MRKDGLPFSTALRFSLPGWSFSDAQGQPIEKVFDNRNEQTGAVAENPVTRSIREGRVVGLANHTVLISKDGNRIPIDESGAPIFDAGRGVSGAVLVFRDVTETRKQAAQLRVQERLVEASHDAIILMEPDRRITKWNRGAAELYGWTEKEAWGRITHELLQTQSEIGPEEIDRILIEQGRWDGELRHRTRDGGELVTEKPPRTAARCGRETGWHSRDQS